MSSRGARIAAALISAVLVVAMGVSGMASAMVHGVVEFGSTGPSSGAPRADVTDLETDLSTDLPTLDPCEELPPELCPTDLPTGDLSPGLPLPSASLSLTPLPSVSLPTPLPSATLPDPDPTSVPVLPELTVEEAIQIANGVTIPPDEVDTGLMFTVHYKKKPLVLDGTEFTALTIDILPSGEAVTRAAVTAQGGVITQNAVATSSATGSNAEPECDDTSFAPLGVKWRASKMPIRWRLDRRSMPRRLPVPKTRKRVKAGLASWVAPRTRCSNAPDTGFSFDFKGRTTRNPKKDGVSTIDWGRLSNSALALTYSWYEGDEIVEFDMRLNKADYKWTVRKKKRRRFQVKNVVAHEAGHALGLGDLSDPHGHQTMFGLIFPGELKKSTLGRGDLRGAEAQSP